MHSKVNAVSAEGHGYAVSKDSGMTQGWIHNALLDGIDKVVTVFYGDKNWRLKKVKQLIQGGESGGVIFGVL